MSDTSTNNSGGGIGLFGAMFIVFLVLKLTGFIDWSWWWVTAPLWGSFLMGLAFFATIGIIYLVLKALNKRATRRAKNHRQEMNRLRAKYDVLGNTPANRDALAAELLDSGKFKWTNWIKK